MKRRRISTSCGVQDKDTLTLTRDSDEATEDDVGDSLGRCCFSLSYPWSARPLDGIPKRQMSELLDIRRMFGAGPA